MNLCKISSLLLLGVNLAWSQQVYMRANQVGYLPDEPKIALAFAQRECRACRFELVDAATGRRVYGPVPFGADLGAFGHFAHHYELDFSACAGPGRYFVRISGDSIRSLPFSIGPGAFAAYNESIIDYIRQQRCGYNPFLDQVCHRLDGRTMYGPMPDSTFIDVSGGWHDAGDYLRYLMTSGNTVCRLLFSYAENKGKFADRYNYFGHPAPNGVADVLDEARWGLDWMLKMHPAADQLFHQVADDRDHLYFDMPYADSSDYGWGEGKYRVVYYATGRPQGLGAYQNTSTGIANLAGRYAAAMAMASEIWRHDLGETGYADLCLKAGREVYAMGLKQPGCQEGTPCRAPYRYHEITWADDMEWGAAELFKATGNPGYLRDAVKFARLIGGFSWMGADTARHYEHYPFMNLGHYALFPLIAPAFQDTLKAYYRENLAALWQRSRNNPYRIGYPFIWCSNNLAAALITQAILYERMSGDTQFRRLRAATQDWLLGRNPWGVSQFVAIPATEGVTPQFPHTVIAEKTGREIVGALNDGPVYGSIYASLKGIRLSRQDPYALFQSDQVVYHDDLWDYSTNEPTLDGTAEALFWLSLSAQPAIESK